MIEVSGKVTALDQGYALVAIAERGCGRCHDDGGCGGNNLAQMLCSSPKVYKVLNSGNANVGDTVSIVMENGALRRGALAAYGWPLFGLFVGAGLGAVFFGDPGSMVGAGVGVLFAWASLRLPGIRKLFSRADSQPRIKSTTLV